MRYIPFTAAAAAATALVKQRITWNTSARERRDGSCHQGGRSVTAVYSLIKFVTVSPGIELYVYIAYIRISVSSDREKGDQYVLSCGEPRADASVFQQSLSDSPPWRNLFFFPSFSTLPGYLSILKTDRLLCLLSFFLSLLQRIYYIYMYILAFR